MTDVFNLIKEKSADWDDFGRELKVSSNFRDVLRSSNRSFHGKLEKVLREWNETEKKDVTWNVLIQVLEYLQMLPFARKVKDFLKKPEVVLRYINASDFKPYS